MKNGIRSHGLSRRAALRIFAGAATAAVTGCSRLLPQSELQLDSASLNRIVFPGNPWSNGHAIEELVWTARLENEGELRFDLHLVSASYDANESFDVTDEASVVSEELTEESSDGPNPEEDEDEATLGDWESKLVWLNFHRCILSSTHWGHRGFVAATLQKPLDFASLHERVFWFDAPPPSASNDRAFGIYLLGNDGVSAHGIRFSASDENRYQLEWQGRIAHEFVGDGEFRHEFQVSADGLTFEGIRLGNQVTVPAAQSAMQKLTRNLGEVVLVKRNGQRWLIPTV